MKKRTKRKIRRRSVTVLRTLAVVVFVAGAFASVVYILFFGGLFYINEVHISSPKAVPQNEVETIVKGWLDGKRWGINRRNNSYLLDEGVLEANLHDQF